MDGADGYSNPEGYQADSDIERLYKFAFEEMDTAIFITNPDGRCLVVNPQALSLTGYSKRQLIGKDVLDFLQANDQTLPIRRDSFPIGKTVITEGRLRRKDGNFLSVELRIRKLPDGSFLETAHDVTEQKQSEEDLRKNEELFRIAFDHAPTGMSIIAPGGKTYLAVNPLLCEMFGYEKEEFLGNTITRTMPLPSTITFTEFSAHPPKRSAAIPCHRQSMLPGSFTRTTDILLNRRFGRPLSLVVMRRSWWPKTMKW